MSTASDFDFLHGQWQVAHRRLTRRLIGSQDWQRFDGSCSVVPILGGAGNIDDNLVNLPGEPYRAVTLRSFDAATARWSIWWLDGRRPHSLDVPVVGSFQHGEGRFRASDAFEGRPILVEFTWMVGAQDQPHWSQAFSADDGASWETNWEMQFHRSG